MIISFNDLPEHIKPFRKKLLHAFEKSLHNASFVMGHDVEEFEREFARYCGAKYCVAVNSGTAALHIALLVHGVKPGDEVITQPNTFIATAEAISFVGAKPIFVDIDPDTAQINIDNIEQVITKRTKVILPVHLFGGSADLRALRIIARKHKLALIEDACQAHGVRYRGIKIGGHGNTACFSFYPSKVLGTIGEGGAILTSDKRLYEKMQMLRNHGQSAKYIHQHIGYNWRMQEMQGFALHVMLPHLERWIRARKKIGALYNRLLGDMMPHVIPLQVAREVEPNFYVYLIRCHQRDALVKFLAERGVTTQMYYPIPLHLQSAYKHLGHAKGSYSIAEVLAKETLALPIYPELREDQVRYIAQEIKNFYAENLYTSPRV
jgi:dTDP-4-amino-4,6-dideoxygalactose transaminase